MHNFRVSWFLWSRISKCVTSHHQPSLFHLQWFQSNTDRCPSNSASHAATLPALFSFRFWFSGLLWILLDVLHTVQSSVRTPWCSPRRTSQAMFHAAPWLGLTKQMLVHFTHTYTPAVVAISARKSNKPKHLKPESVVDHKAMPCHVLSLDMPYPSCKPNDGRYSCQGQSQGEGWVVVWSLSVFNITQKHALSSASMSSSVL